MDKKFKCDKCDWEGNFDMLVSETYCPICDSDKIKAIPNNPLSEFNESLKIAFKKTPLK